MRQQKTRRWNRKEKWTENRHIKISSSSCSNLTSRLVISPFTYSASWLKSQGLSKVDVESGIGCQGSSAAASETLESQIQTTKKGQHLTATLQISKDNPGILAQRLQLGPNPQSTLASSATTGSSHSP